MRAVAALVCAALLAAPLAHATAPTLERALADIGSKKRLEEWSGKPLSLADADGDGDLDLVAQNRNGRVYVVDLREGRAIAEVQPTSPYARDIGPFNGARAADLDGDGRVELVGINRAAWVSVWTLGDATRPRWEVHLDAHHPHPTADAGPVLADLDADGETLEILAQTEERGSFALRHDGSTLWSLDAYGGNAEPVAADVDGDGDLDAVFFTDGGIVRVVDGPTGEELWAFEARRHDVWPGSVASAGVVDDLDGDGRVEVAFCARNVEDATTDYAPGAPLYEQHHFALFLVRDGELLWKRKPSWGNPLCAAQLMATDADGDGRKELYGMDWNTIGHKPGNWERLGDAHVFAFDHAGAELWRRDVDAWNAKANLALADGDGDGRVDVLAYDARSLLVLDAQTGERRARVDLAGWSVKQGPVVGDLLGDGTARAALAAEGRSHALLLVRLPESDLEAPWPGWAPPAQSPRVRVAEAPAPPPAPPAEKAPTPERPAEAAQESARVDRAPAAPERAEAGGLLGAAVAALALAAAQRRRR